MTLKSVIDKVNEFIKSYKSNILDLYIVACEIDIQEQEEIISSGRSLWPVCHSIRRILEEIVVLEMVDELLPGENIEIIRDYLLTKLKSSHAIIIEQDTDIELSGGDTHWLQLIGLGDVSLLIESNLRDYAL